MVEKHPNEKELERLLHQAISGDRDALAELCEKYYPKVLRYMWYRVGERDAEDLAGEVFLRVIRSIDKQRGNFEAWLYRIAGNVVNDWNRKRKRSKGTALPADEMDAMFPTKNRMKLNEHQDCVAEAISRLTDEQREFIILKFVQGMSNEEISEITGKTIGALRALQFRALSSLRRMLKEKTNGKRPRTNSG